MSTNFITNLSSFLIDENEISEIGDKLERLKRFSDNDVFPFQIQDKVNSTFSLLNDCSEKSRICYELCNELQVLDAFSEHKDNSRVRLVLDKHDSVGKLLQKSISELEYFQKRLRKFENFLKEIVAELVRAEDLVCNKCEGRGYSIKTKYVRERGSSPQPYTESVNCDRCEGTGKIFLDSELKKELTDFVQAIKPIQINFKIYKNTLENYLKEYQIPSLEGYDPIEKIFPDEDSKRKKIQQSLVDF